MLRRRSPATTAIIYAREFPDPGAGAESRTRTMVIHIRASPHSTQRHATPAPVIQCRQAGHMPVADDLQRSPWLLSANLAGNDFAAPPAQCAPEAHAPRASPLTAAGFLGKPLRSFARFGLQDAQTPPSPRVGEESRGDEGQTRLQARRPRSQSLLHLQLPSHQHRHIGIPDPWQPHAVTPGGIRRTHIVPGGNRRIEALQAVLIIRDITHPPSPPSLAFRGGQNI
jgi:hypothetical protein